MLSETPNVKETPPRGRDPDCCTATTTISQRCPAAGRVFTPFCGRHKATQPSPPPPSTPTKDGQEYPQEFIQDKLNGKDIQFSSIVIARVSKATKIFDTREKFTLHANLLVSHRLPSKMPDNDHVLRNRAN